MDFNLGYGKKLLNVKIEEKNILAVLEPNEVDIQVTGIEEVRRAMQSPIGSKRLKEIVKPGEKVVIITSDLTRPMPSKLVLPEIINELEEAGIELKDITVVFGLGVHRKQTEEEKKYLAGEDVYNKVRCIDSDPHDCVHMGQTERGTPADVFTPVAQADRRICLGNIEYHYFAGYSGGAKAIMPGVSSKAAIQANHSKMVKAEAKAGEMDNNPVRQDIDDIAKFVPIDFILNVVLDEKKNVIKAVAGHYIEAHREGCRFLDQLYKVKIKRQADIVVVSAGGYPKDINIYQAQKALDNAQHAVRDGGIIILVASCKEGYGEKTFEKWLVKATSPEQTVKDIQVNFELGGHKAAAIGMTVSKCKVFLVSELDDEISKYTFMKPYEDLQTAFNEALEIIGDQAETIIMPFGGSTLPVVE